MTRAEALAEFYAARSDHLWSIVAAQVRTGDVTILDDACQQAWLTLARRADISLDDRGAAWLATVAVREGWRLARVPRAVPSGAFRGEAGLDGLEAPEPAAADGDPEARAIARETYQQRADAFHRLQSSQRRDLFLHALGYSYAEVAAMTGASVRTVTGRLSRGRARLRKYRRLSANAPAQRSRCPTSGVRWPSKCEALQPP